MYGVLLFVTFSLIGSNLSADFYVTPIKSRITVTDGYSSLLEFKIRPWPPPRSDREYDDVKITLRNDKSNQTLCTVHYKLGKYVKDLHSCNTRFVPYNPEFSDKVVFHLERTHLIDMGTYSMTLTFASGQKKKTVTTHVTVQKAPSTVSVSKSPVGTLTEGDYINLTCSTTDANPPAQLTWTRGHYRDIDNDPKLFHQAKSWRDWSVRNVTVGPLTRHDHGISYICRAWNSVNGYDNPAVGSLSVNVTHKPFATITHCPQHDIRYHVLEGSDAHMRTKVEAYPEVTSTSWSWKDQPIENILKNTSREHLHHVYKFGDGERNLVLFDVTRKMAGDYQFTVTNSLGTFKAKCELDVLYPPKITLPEEVTVVENGFLEITCQADANPPVHEYHWKKNGHVIQEHEVALTIAHVQPEDMAEYSCEAVNMITETGAEFGQKATGTAYIQVNVEYKPRWTKHHPNKVAPREGAKGVTLVCDIDSYPKPDFQWLFKGKAITSMDPRISVVNNGNGRSHLDISHLKDSDYGTYVCHPMNVQGEDYFPIKLTKPGIPDAPEYCRIADKNATSVQLQCDVGFDGGSYLSYIVHAHITHHKAEVITYVFYKEEDHVVTLVISDLDPNTQYSIQIQAVNKYGKSKSNLEVIVQTSDGEPVEHHAVMHASSTNPGAIVGLCLGVLLIILVVTAAVAGLKGYLQSPTKYYRKVFVRRPTIKSTKLGRQYAELGQFSITEDDAGLLDCEQGPDVVTSPPVIMTSSLEKGANVYGSYRHSGDQKPLKETSRPRPLTLEVPVDVHQNAAPVSPTSPTGMRIPVSVPRKERASRGSRGSRGSDEIELVHRQASVEDRWEYSRDNLKLGWKLQGGGTFSDVWRATADHLVPGKNNCVVAAKILKADATKDEKKFILREMALMKNIQHHQHILKMLACCTKGGPPIMLMEYMSRGTLLEVLRDHRGKVPLRPSGGSQLALTSRDLTVFALHIVSGLEFIFAHGWIHRDLSCRNILVDKELCCKLSDFNSVGEIRDRRQHEAKIQRKLPLRWMAPESMYDCIYSVQTDIWTLGVVLWEIITLGSTPYPGLSGTDVMELVHMDYRMKRPKNCPDTWFEIMTNCWSNNPKDRPEVSSVRELLESYLAEVESEEEENLTLSELRENIDEIMENTGGEKC